VTLRRTDPEKVEQLGATWNSYASVAHGFSRPLRRTQDMYLLHADGGTIKI